VVPPEGMPELPFRWLDGPDPDLNAKRHWYNWNTLGEERDAQKRKEELAETKVELAAKKAAIVDHRAAGELALESSDWEVAEAEFKDAIAIDPDGKLVPKPTFGKSLGQLLLRAQLGGLLESGDEAAEGGALSAAAEAYESAVKLDPDNSSGWNAAKKLKQTQEKIEKARKAKVAEHRAAAEAALKAKDYPAAQAALGEAKELDPDDNERPVLHDTFEQMSAVAQVGADYDNAVQLLKDGQFSESVAMFEACVAADPDDKSGLKLQKQLAHAEKADRDNMIYPWE
jgi:tetratricopeptide (TPR) repeat protein